MIKDAFKVLQNRIIIWILYSVSTSPSILTLTCSSLWLDSSAGRDKIVSLAEKFLSRKEQAESAFWVTIWKLAKFTFWVTLKEQAKFTLSVTLKEQAKSTFWVAPKEQAESTLWVTLKEQAEYTFWVTLWEQAEYVFLGYAKRAIWVYILGHIFQWLLPMYNARLDLFFISDYSHESISAHKKLFMTY